MTSPMPIVPVVSSSDGPRITVSEYTKSPKVVPTAIINMLDQQMIIDSGILRDAGQNDSGVYRFTESDPLYADAELRIRAEGGEIPIAQHSRGTPQAVQSEERPLAMTITDEDVRRNDVNNVRKKMEQLKNTIVVGWDDALFDYFLGHPRIPRFPVSTPWGASNADQRTDILRGSQVVSTATDQRGSRFNFRLDTLMMNEETELDLMVSKTFNVEAAMAGVGNEADQSMRYTGLRPRRILQKNILVNWRIPTGHVIGLMKGRVGFKGDELPLQATQLYRDEPRKTRRSDTERVTAAGIDNPLACVIFEGV